MVVVVVAVVAGHHNYPDTHHLYLRTSDIYLHFLAALENCSNPVSQPGAELGDNNLFHFMISILLF